jgi:hypothetical protein
VGGEEVCGAGAEALSRQLEDALDLVARGLQPHALAANLHAPSIGALSRPL